MAWRRLGVLGCLVLGGCTQLDFGEGENPQAVTFYDPQRVAVITTDKTCKMTATLTVSPGKKRWVKPRSGLDAGKLSLAFENGMIKTLGHETDGGAAAFEKVTGALSGLGVFGLEAAGEPAAACTPKTEIYPLEGDLTSPIVLEGGAPPKADKE